MPLTVKHADLHLVTAIEQGYGWFQWSHREFSDAGGYRCALAILWDAEGGPDGELATSDGKTRA